MAEALPDPPVATDADCRSLPGFMLNVERLLDSELWALSTGDEFKAAVTLWGKAWKQVPAGSLPDNDRVLASFSGAGNRWEKVKKMALHGFVKCSDGRLYHLVLCEDVKRAIDSQKRHMERREKDAERLRKWREKPIRNAFQNAFQNAFRNDLETRIDIDKDKDKDKDMDKEGDSVAVPNRTPSKYEKKESDAAREEQNFVNGNPVLQPCGLPPQAPKTETLKSNIKAQLRQKLMRYCNARMRGSEKDTAISGLMGEDTNHDAQWWLDEIDRRRKREGWDDTREWKRKHIGAAGL